jgi:hypothetical protein
MSMRPGRSFSAIPQSLIHRAAHTTFHLPVHRAVRPDGNPGAWMLSGFFRIGRPAKHISQADREKSHETHQRLRVAPASVS